MYCVAYNFISLYEKMNSKSVGVRNFRFILFHSRPNPIPSTLPVYLSHFLPSHLVPFPSLISPSLTITHASFPLISFPSFPLMSSPLISFHLLSYHFISFHLIGDYTHQINSSSGSGSSSNFSHLFDWVKIAHR